MSDKTYTCIACNGLGEIGVVGIPDITVGCFDCDYDGLVTKEKQTWQREHRVEGT